MHIYDKNEIDEWFIPEQNERKQRLCVRVVWDPNEPHRITYQAEPALKLEKNTFLNRF